MKLKFIKLSICILLFSSCSVYRMPTDDDMTAVPMTNNPHVVHDKGSSMPGVSY